MHMPELGPEETWWILDTATDRYVDFLGTPDEVRARARELEELNPEPVFL